MLFQYLLLGCLVATVQKELPSNLRVRPLERGDYDKKFLDCLAELTVVGNLTKEKYQGKYVSNDNR